MARVPEPSDFQEKRKRGDAAYGTPRFFNINNTDMYSLESTAASQISITVVARRGDVVGTFCVEKVPLAVGVPDIRISSTALEQVVPRVGVVGLLQGSLPAGVACLRQKAVRFEGNVVVIPPDVTTPVARSGRPDTLNLVLDAVGVTFGGVIAYTVHRNIAVTNDNGVGIRGIFPVVITNPRVQRSSGILTSLAPQCQHGI